MVFLTIGQVDHTSDFEYSESTSEVQYFHLAHKMLLLN